MTDTSNANASKPGVASKPTITPQPPRSPSIQVPGKPLVAPAPLTAVKTVPFTIDTSHERGKYLKLLAYAEYGVGKTFLMGTAADIPEMRDVIIVNCEAGDLTLHDPEHEFHLIDSVRVRDYATLGRVQEYLKLHCRLRDEGNIEKLKATESSLRKIPIEEIEVPRMYRTCILDSLSEAEAYCMYQLLGITDTTKIDEESAAPEWAEYRRNHMMVQRLIRSFRDLNMHVLFTCGRSYVQDESKRFLYSPALTGKLSNQAQGFVDMVGYMVSQPVSSTAEGEGASEKKIARRMYVQPVGRFAAKCRFSSFKGTYFDNPDMKMIMKAINLPTVTHI